MVPASAGGGIGENGESMARLKNIPEPGGYFLNTDIVQFEPGEGLHEHICRYPMCDKVFYSDNKYVRYCSDKCRYHHHNTTEEGHAFVGWAWLGRERST